MCVCVYVCVCVFYCGVRACLFYHSEEGDDNDECAHAFVCASMIVVALWAKTSRAIITATSKSKKRSAGIVRPVGQRHGRLVTSMTLSPCSRCRRWSCREDRI